MPQQVDKTVNKFMRCGTFMFTVSWVNLLLRYQTKP